MSQHTLKDACASQMAQNTKLKAEVERLATINDKLLEALEGFIRDDGHCLMCNPWEDEDGECLPACINAKAAIAEAKGE